MVEGPDRAATALGRLTRVHREWELVAYDQHCGGTLRKGRRRDMPKRHARQPDGKYQGMNAYLTPPVLTALQLEHSFVVGVDSSHQEPAINWISRTATTCHDANDEVDQGDIDFPTIEYNGTYHFGGWAR